MHQMAGVMHLSAGLVGLKTENAEKVVVFCCIVGRVKGVTRILKKSSSSPARCISRPFWGPKNGLFDAKCFGLISKNAFPV